MKTGPKRFAETAVVQRSLKEAIVLSSLEAERNNAVDKTILSLVHL